MYIIFQKDVDNFDIEHKTCQLGGGAVPHNVIIRVFCLVQTIRFCSTFTISSACGRIRKAYQIMCGETDLRLPCPITAKCDFLGHCMFRIRFEDKS